MKNFLKSALLLMILNLSLSSCSIEEEIITGNDSVVSETQPANQDDDPEIEEPED